MSTPDMDAGRKMNVGIKFKTAPPSTCDTSLGERYRAVRGLSEHIAQPLHVEDQVIQSMPDVSPTKWHLAHTTWFFETFILKPHATDYVEFRAGFDFLFNSYYNSIGRMHPRSKRGLISRPTVVEVRDFRNYVDAAMDRFSAVAEPDLHDDVAQVIEIGLQHEQQHQELMLTDIKHVLSCNSLVPAAYPPAGASEGTAGDVAWHAFDGGLVEIGHAGGGFAFDNETPRHEVQLRPFALADRAVTNAEFAAFIDDGGYARPEMWLSDGWVAVQAQDWQAPLYWHRREEGWHAFTFAGLQPLADDAPVAHVSYYEADAFARWASARLPTEAEWETCARGVPVAGNFLAAANAVVASPLPRTARDTRGLRQLFGDVWEWTQSPYVAYPGFRPLPGNVGEYNGKFMCNQLVLRGGSCLTPASHIRPTYRNFFPADTRWQMSGVRLARDID